MLAYGRQSYKRATQSRPAAQHNVHIGASRGLAPGATPQPVMPRWELQVPSPLLKPAMALSASQGWHHLQHCAATGKAPSAPAWTASCAHVPCSRPAAASCSCWTACCASGARCWPLYGTQLQSTAMRAGVLQLLKWLLRWTSTTSTYIRWDGGCDQYVYQQGGMLRDAGKVRAACDSGSGSNH